MASSEPLLEAKNSDQDGACKAAVRSWGKRGWEFARAVLPLSFFIVIYCGVFVQQWFINHKVIGGLLCVIVGLTLFKYGLTFGLMPFSEDIGDKLPSKQSDIGLVLTTTLLGTVVTFAEPGIDSLQMVGRYVEKPQPLLKWLLMTHPTTLLCAIAAGVGVAAGVGMLRIKYQFRFFYILVSTVPVCIIITICSGSSKLFSILALAWDSGCITTGPATVPIVLALGTGVSRASQDANDDESQVSGFGVVTLASLFPILTVLLCGIAVMFFGDLDVDDIIAVTKAPTNAGAPVDPPFEDVLRTQVTMALHSIMPLTLYLLAVQFIIIRERLVKPMVFIKGVLFAFCGLATFNVGLFYGSLKLGDEAGNALPDSLTEYHGIGGTSCILFFGFATGLMATFIDLEPCGMGELVEHVTNGKVKKMPLFLTIAIGVGTGVAVGFARILYSWNLNYVLLLGYPLAILISNISDETLVCIAWDSAGVTTGPVTVPLVLSLGVGIADDIGGQAFGILACCPPFAITSVLILGLIKMPPKRLIELKDKLSPKRKFSDAFTPRAATSRMWRRDTERPHSLSEDRFVAP